MTPYSTPAAPAPLSLGDTFGTTWRVYKRAIGLFVLLAFLPTIAVFVLAVPLVLAGIAIGQSTGEAGAAPFLVIALAIALLIFVLLYQWRCAGMTSVAVVDLLDGRPKPTLGDLHGRTKGLMGRVALLFILVFFVVGFLGVLSLLPVGAIAAAASGQGGSADTAAAGAIGTLFLVGLLWFVVGIILTARLLYFVPALGVEGLSGFDALKRSWSLTKGEFWRTLGFYIVATIVVGLPVAIVQFVGQLALLPSMMSGREPNPVALGLYGLVVLVVSVLAAPLLAIVITVMYADRRRRVEAAGAYGQPLTPPPAGGGYPPVQ